MKRSIFRLLMALALAFSSAAQAEIKHVTMVVEGMT